MRMTLFKGAGVAIVTPFSGGRVDFDSLERLLEWQLQQGIDAVISCGTTGEASTLGDGEHISVVEFTVDKVAGRVPVIGGAGSNDTAHAVAMARSLSDVGADGLLLVTPYYNKCTQKGLIEHYMKIADATELPSIIYSVPGRTGVNILPETVLALSNHPRIAGIKEASGNIAQVLEIARLCPSDFSIYSGNDDMIVPVLSLGGVGTISTVANVAPKATHDMVMAYLSGDIERSRMLQLSLKPLIDALFLEVNPIPVKAALNMMGFIKREYRLPLCEPDNKTLYRLLCELKDLGIPTI